MSLKAVLTFLVAGALSINALIIPVARSPAPELESQELEARMLLFSRELQVLTELLSREPEDWTRGHYTAKREPCPGCILSKPAPAPAPAPPPPPAPPPTPAPKIIAPTPRPGDPKSGFKELDASYGNWKSKDDWRVLFEPRPQGVLPGITDVAKGKGKRGLLD